MDIISVAEADRADLEAALQSAGLTFTVAREERYFGDPDTWSVVIDAAKFVAALLPALINFAASRKKSTMVVNGVEIRIKGPVTDADCEKIRKALNQ